MRARLALPLVLLGLLVEVGCGSSGVGADGPPGGDGSTAGGDAGVGVPDGLTCVPTSGSRLRRGVRQHSDGTSVDVAIRDRALGVDCAFEATTDGSHRCVPGTGTYGIVPRYTDAACTTMIALLAEPPRVEEPPRIGRVIHDDGEPCTNEPTFYALGGTVEVTLATPLYALAGTSCLASTAPVGIYHTVTGAADLVSARPAWVGGRLSMLQLDAEDGSRWCDVWGELRDEDLDGRACTLGFGDDQAIRCLPAARSVQAMFSDPSCTTEVEVTFSQTCERSPRFARESGGDGCGGARFRELGVPFQGELYELGFEAGGGCGPSPRAGQVLTVVGAPLPATTFASMIRSYAPLGGRLERGDLAGSGLRLFRSQLRDVDLDVPCAFEAVGDGTLRCLPSRTRDREDVVADTFAGFADPACTTPRRVAITGACPQAVPTYARDGISVFRVGARSATPIYEIADGCVAKPDVEVYELGEEVLAAELVSGVLAIE